MGPMGTQVSFYTVTKSTVKTKLSVLTHPGDGAQLEEQNLIRLHRVEYSLSPKPSKVTFHRVNSQTTLTEVNVWLIVIADVNTRPH